MLVGQPPFLANTAEETQYKVIKTIKMSKNNVSHAIFFKILIGNKLEKHFENSSASKIKQ